MITATLDAAYRFVGVFVAKFRLEAADLLYCWWNLADQLRLVVSPVIYKALYISGG